MSLFFWSEPAPVIASSTGVRRRKVLLDRLDRLLQHRHRRLRRLHGRRPTRRACAGGWCHRPARRGGQRAVGGRGRARRLRADAEQVEEAQFLPLAPAADVPCCRSFAAPATNCWPARAARPQCPSPARARARASAARRFGRRSNGQVLLELCDLLLLRLQLLLQLWISASASSIFASRASKPSDDTTSPPPTSLPCPRPLPASPPLLRPLLRVLRRGRRAHLAAAAPRHLLDPLHLSRSAAFRASSRACRSASSRARRFARRSASAPAALARRGRARRAARCASPTASWAHLATSSILRPFFLIIVAALRCRSRARA